MRYKILCQLRVIFLAAVAGVAAPLLVSAQSLPGSNFEIDPDANLVRDNPIPSTDWVEVDFLLKEEEFDGSDDDSFGQGTKEDTEVPSPVTGSIPPNKSDLKSFGIYSESNSSGDFIHVFWTRVQDPKGTTNMDFEFNQSGIMSANGITPERTPGDKLIVYELSKGGVVPQLFILTWLDGSEGIDCDASNSYPCWGDRDNLSASGGAAGSINANPIPLAESTPELGAFDARTFGEASINFDVLLPGSGEQCTTFGSVYLKSRSSDSFTAALKDYIAPLTVTITNCGTITISKVDDADNPVVGAEFTLYESNGNDVFNPPIEDPVATDPATNEPLTCTTDDTGICQIANILHGDYWLDETMVPDGYVKTTELPALITVSEDNTGTGGLLLSYTNPRERGSLLIQKVVQGTTDRLSGAGFEYDSDGDDTVDTALTEVSTGLFCVDNLLEGSYLVAETTVPSGYSGAAAQIVSATVPSTCAERVAAADGPDATFENEAITTLVTSANETVTVGQDIHDTAMLSGGYNPTGTITFKLYTNNTCSGDPIFTDSVTVDGNGSYQTSYTTSSVGTYYWLASYSGDGSNAGSTHDCAVEGEVDTVEAAATTLSTTPNLLPNDSATLGGGFGTLSGSITFELYASADCSGIDMYSETVSVSGAGTYETSNDSVYITADGTYSWLVTFTSDDANSQGSVSACDQEQYVIDITPLAP